MTGAAGLLGRHAVRILTEQSARVIALDRVARGTPDVREIVADLFDRDAVARILDETAPTHLLHLAWCAEPQRFWTDPDNVRWIGASLDLANAFIAAGGRRIVGAGTCAEYLWDGRPLGERSSALAPATLYGAAKAAVGVVLPQIAAASGASAAWARIFFLYGRGERPERFVSRALDALAGGPTLVLTDPDRTLDYVHAEDAARALVALLGREFSGAVNIGSGRGANSYEILAEIAAVTGRMPPHEVRRGAPAANVVSDPAVLESVLPAFGFRSWHAGIADQVQGSIASRA